MSGSTIPPEKPDFRDGDVYVGAALVALVALSWSLVGLLWAGYALVHAILASLGS